MSTITGSIRVLHVDDDPNLAEMTATFLKREDERFVIETATSADEGLDRLPDDEFDCIISDYDMPGQNGIEFLEAVREEHPDLPFILYTGKGSEEIASDAISAGVTDYLQKRSGTGQYTVLANRIRNAVEQYHTQTALAEREQRLNLFFEQSPLGVIEWNDNFELRRMNDAAEEMLGYEQQTLAGESWEAIVPESDRPAVREVVSDLLENTGGYHSINENVREDGERIACEWHNRVITDDDGEVLAVFSQFQDITDQQRLKQKREEIIERVTDAIVEVDADWRFTLVNKNAENLYDMTEDDLLGRNFWDVFEEARGTRFEEEYREVMETREPTSFVEYFSGLEGWFDIEVYPKDDGGIAFYFVEITEQRQRQDELEAEQRFISQALDTLDDIFYVVSPDGDLQRWNERVEEVTGYSETEIEAMNALDFFPEDEREGIATSIETTLETGTDQVEAELLTGDGTRIPYQFRSRRLMDSKGELLGIAGIGRDLTELRAREQELRETKRRLDLVLEETETGIWEWKIGTNDVEWNETMERAMGLEPGSFAGTYEAFAERVHPDDLQQVEAAIDQAIETDEPYHAEFRMINEERETVWAEARGLIIEEEDEPDRMVGLFRDITGRKEREDRLRDLNETTHRLMSAKSRERVSELGVGAARDVLGLEANAIHLYDDEQAGLVPITATDTATDLIGDIPTLTEGDSIAWRVYEQGEALALDDVHDDSDILNPETDLQSELYLPLDEHGILIAASETVETFDQQDAVLGEILAGSIAGALKNVERTERLRTREQVLTQQNDRLEEFASIVSHDLRNPLNVAEGQLEMANEECESEHLDDVNRALARMNALIDDLLTLAREGEQVGEPKPIDLEILTETCWHNVATAEATLKTDIDRRIQADQSRLQQLLENLMRNAVEHGGEDATVTIGELDDGFYVEDDGPGIPEEKQDDVFEAGYSTAEDGTGFGLSIVKQVAQAHGWDVRVTDGSEGGARFEITGVEFVAE